MPGWYIKHRPRGPRAYNGKESDFLAKALRVLPAERIRAIAFQVEQQCRTVATTAYQTDTGKK